MTIKFLKAGTGDCILIQHAQYNIIIDGGNDSTHLLAQVKEIHNAGNHIDLLIITHQDDDHIKGIIDLLNSVNNKDFGNNFITEIMFNSPNLLSETLIKTGTNELSFKQANEVEELIKNIGITHIAGDSNTNPKEYGNLKIRFLSPETADLIEYKDAAGSYLNSDYRRDWDISMDSLALFIDDKSQDSTLFNRTSIVTLVECDNKRVLLTGDVTPSRFIALLNKLCQEEGTNKLKFDYIKLPHHCSYRSLNKLIFPKIICDKYIISTNARKYNLPNKRGILKVIKYQSKEIDIEFLFNYEEALNSLKLTTQEAKKYRFKLTKNNNDYGLSI